MLSRNCASLLSTLDSWDEPSYSAKLGRADQMDDG